MTKQSEDFARFGAFVCENRDWKSFNMDFWQLCEMLGADPNSLDEMLLEELGMSGDEVLESLREDKRAIPNKFPLP